MVVEAACQDHFSQLTCFLTAYWRCCYWAAGDKFSAFKRALGCLFVNAQNHFLTATFLLPLLSAWGLLGHLLNTAGVKACALFCQ